MRRGEGNPDIIPQFYYDELHKIGKDNLCDGKYVEGLGYIFPEVIVTATKPNDYETFYNLNMDMNVLVSAPPQGPKIVPFFILEKKYKDVYRHHVNAITKRGKPALLTYDSNPVKRNKRRKDATDLYVSLYPAWERDEYPYATTMEGGTGASVEYVLPSNNASHGRYIRTIRSAFQMQTGDQFHIILVPDMHKEYELYREPIPEPVPVPVLKPEYQKKYEPVPAPFPVPEVNKWGVLLAAMTIVMATIDMAVSRVFMIVVPPTLMDKKDDDFYNNNPGES